MKNVWNTWLPDDYSTRVVLEYKIVLRTPVLSILYKDLVVLCSTWNRNTSIGREASLESRQASIYDFKDL